MIAGCFADTFFFLALLDKDDDAHEEADAFIATFVGRIVTTEWILTELGDAYAGQRDRERFVAFVRYLRSKPGVMIVRSSGELFDRGLEFYASRRDKEWSLTDCISFVVMHDFRLTDALTGDHHFEQAGFKMLLA